MVHLDTDQPVLTQPEYAVVTGGDYAETDLVDVYRVGQPEQVVAYYAQFIYDGSYP
jgi:hypothetical protein